MEVEPRWSPAPVLWEVCIHRKQDFLARMQTFFWGGKAAVCKPSSSLTFRYAFKGRITLVEGRGVKVYVYSRHTEDIV